MKINKLRKKSFRDAYVKAQLTHGIAHQIRDMRGERGWSQAELASKLGLKTQSAVARMESASYGKLSINTLLKLSSVFDVALSVRFQSFSRFLIEREDLRKESLRADSFDNDILITNYGCTGTNETVLHLQTATEVWMDLLNGDHKNLYVSMLEPSNSAQTKNLTTIISIVGQSSVTLPTIKIKEYVCQNQR